MGIHKQPDRIGHYWGRWHTPAPGTADSGYMCDGDTWEVHQVWMDDELKVFVPGVSKPQYVDGFEWGPRVAQFFPS